MIRIIAGALAGIIMAWVLLYPVNDNDGNGKHNQKRSTNSRYTLVEFHGLQLYTGGAPAYLDEKETILNPECLETHGHYGQVVTETTPQMQCYLGRDDATSDVKDRLRIIEDALQVAQQQQLPTTDDDDTTLHIFVVPEFYWRGVNGAYQFGDDTVDDPNSCGPICRILQGLEAIVAQPQFKNWFFVFGTILASERLPTEDPYDYLFYNFAPIYKGYDPTTTSSTGKRFLLPKRYVSSSDFLTPQRHLTNPSVYEELFGNHQHPAKDTTVDNPFDMFRKRYDDRVFKRYKDELNDLGYSMIEYDWIMVDGLSFSLEICFDHQMRTALNTYLGDMVTGRHTRIPSSSDDGLSYTSIPEYQAQISIVSSAGMTVVAESLALTNNGTMFLQDGLSNTTTFKYWNAKDSCEVGVQFEGGTEAITRQTLLSSTDVRFLHSVHNATRATMVYEKDWESAIAGLFSATQYPPRIVSYGPVDIATVHRR